MLVTLGFAVALPSVANADDVNGPRCADISSGGGFYDSSGLLTGRITLSSPACQAFAYTFFVRTASGTLELAPVASDATGATLFFQTTLDPAANPSVCVSFTSSVGGGHHVFDVAPDAEFGCREVGLGDNFAVGFS